MWVGAYAQALTRIIVNLAALNVIIVFILSQDALMGPTLEAAYQHSNLIS